MLLHRTKNYQKKVTNIGTMSNQKICCRTIQAAWRGYQARKEYRHLLRSHYKSGQSSINRDLQRKFYQQEVTTLATKLDDNMSSRAAQVDTLLTSMERTLDDSRQLDRLFEDMLRNRQQNRAELRLPPMHDADEATGLEPPPQRRDYLGGILTPRSAAFSLQPPALPGDDGAVDAAPRIFSGTEFCIETSTPWSQVQKQALCRGQSDCAICMLPVSADVSLLHDLPSRAKLQPNVKHSVLLSCSHVFHQHCIGNFERFTRNEVSARRCVSHCTASPVTVLHVAHRRRDRSTAPSAAASTASVCCDRGVGKSAMYIPTNQSAKCSLS